MRPLWASSILRVSWKSSTIGKCPRCEAGRTVGTGALRFSSRSTTGGGVSTRAARHMWGFGRFGRSLRGGGNGRVPCSNLDTGETETSPREERGRHGRERETPNDAGGCSGQSIPARRGNGAFSTWLTGDCMEPTLAAGMMGVWVPRIPEVGEIGLYRLPPYSPRTQRLARIKGFEAEGGRVC